MTICKSSSHQKYNPTSCSSEGSHGSRLCTNIILVNTLEPRNEKVGSFRNYLVLDTSDTVVDDTTVTRINYRK